VKSLSERSKRRWKEDLQTSAGIKLTFVAYSTELLRTQLTFVSFESGAQRGDFAVLNWDHSTEQVISGGNAANLGS